MALGESIGNQFLLDPQQQTGGSQGSAQPRGGQEQGPDISGFIGKPNEGLEDVENLTSNYYSSWANLNSYAKAAWKNYGIDVTAPDFSDPAQQKFNMSFLKGVADLKARGNALQRGRENQVYNAKQRATNADFFQQDPIEGQITSSEGTGTTALTSADKEVAQYRDKIYNTKSEQRAANAKVEEGYLGARQFKAEVFYT